jgi:hypothetical protein
MLLIAGFAAVVAFMAELRSWFIFGDCVGSHEWTPHDVLEACVNWLLQAFPAFFFMFGLWGIAALFMKDSILTRAIFLLFAIPMLLLPVLRGETERLLLIGLAICIYAISRWLAEWAYNQRPRDWKTILAERKRLAWGAEEFALALTHGRASDGNPLAIILRPGEDRINVPDNIHEPPPYEALATLLRLRIRQRFRRVDISDNWISLVSLLEAQGCPPEEREELSNTMIYAHPEIADRARPLIGK